MGRRFNSENRIVEKVVGIIGCVVHIDDQRDGVGTAAGKAACKVIRHIFQLLHRRVNALLGLLGDYALIVKHS